MIEKKEALPEAIVRDMKRQARRKFMAKEKTRIVLEGLRGETGITDLCGTKTHRPATQGKIERYHRSMKNLVLSDHYQAPAEPDERIREGVDYDNHQRYHEAIDNVAPADRFYGRDRMIPERRKSPEGGHGDAKGAEPNGDA